MPHELSGDVMASTPVETGGLFTFSDTKVRPQRSSLIRGDLACKFCLAWSMIVILILLQPSAFAFSFPFDFPFCGGADEGPELILDLEETVPCGESLTYTVRLKNHGDEALSDVSLRDNFGQIGLLASLPPGEMQTLTRTTPPIEDDTALRVTVRSKGKRICNKEVDISVGPEVTTSDDQTVTESEIEDVHLMKVMSHSPESEGGQGIDLSFEVSPEIVHAGDEAKIEMTVTNLHSETLRKVKIKSSEWNILVGSLKPGESKTLSKSLMVSEDVSLDLEVEGTSRDEKMVFDQNTIKVSVIEPSIDIAIVTTPALPGEEVTCEYRLENSGDDVLSRVILKDSDGVVLGILPELNPDETQSLIRKQDPGKRSNLNLEVTCTDSAGQTLTRKTKARSFVAGGSGAPSSSSSFSSTPSSPSSSSSSSTSSSSSSSSSAKPSSVTSPRNSQDEAESMGFEFDFSTPDFDNFDTEFDLGDFGQLPKVGEAVSRPPLGADCSAERPSKIASQASAPERQSVESEKGTVGGSERYKLDVTLHVDKAITHRGDSVLYRCTAENSGKYTLKDIELRCGEKTTSSQRLSPGDCLTLEGAIRVETAMDLVATAEAKNLRGDRLEDKSSVKIKAISPDMKLEISASPLNICRGERVSIEAKVENTGDDPLVDVVISDSLGEIGTITMLNPGEKKSLRRDSTLDESLDDEISATASDSASSVLRRSETVHFHILKPELEISVEPEEVVGYFGESTDVVWTIKNTGDANLDDVTFIGGDGDRYRLSGIPVGESITMSATYTSNKSREVRGRAEASVPGENIVSDSTALQIRAISPGISLTAKPSLVEVSSYREINISCLVTNTGNDVLRGVIISEEGTDFLEHVGTLEPGDFKVVTFKFLADANRTFHFETGGIDSAGRSWPARADAELKLVTTALALTVLVDPPLARLGEAVKITFSAENQGSVPLFSTFIMGKSLGHLGTIDYIAPGSCHTVEAEMVATGVIDDLITAEGFTKDGFSVNDKYELHVGLFEPPVAPIVAEEQPSKVDVLEVETGFGDVSGSLDSRAKTPVAIGDESKTAEESTAVAGETLTSIAPTEIRDMRPASVEEKAQTNAGGETFVEGETSASPEDLASSIGQDEMFTSVGLGDERAGDVTEVELKTSDFTENDVDKFDIGTGSLPCSSEESMEIEQKNEYSTSGISDLMERLRTMLENIRLRKAKHRETPTYLENVTEIVPPSTESTRSPSEQRPDPVQSYSYDDLISDRIMPAEVSPEEVELDLCVKDPTSEDISPSGVVPKQEENLQPSEDPAPGAPSFSEAFLEEAEQSYCYLRTDTGTASESSLDGVRQVLPTEDLISGSEATDQFRVDPSLEGLRARSISEKTREKADDAHFGKCVGSAKLPAEKLTCLEIDKPPEIVNVGVFPPEPVAGSPVVVSVHASDDKKVDSVNMVWGMASTSVSRSDLLDVDRTRDHQMALESGTSKEGYWNYEIEGQPAGTYMTVLIRVSDGVRWSEAGPYLLFWKTASSDVVTEETASKPSSSGSVPSSQEKVQDEDEGMYYIESTTVVGKGDVSVDNEFRESSVRFREELDGSGSIEMQSQKLVNKGAPVMNFSDSRLLVFDEGNLKGFKKMVSPRFHDGMGASVTERFNTTSIQKSEVGTIKSLNQSENTLSFDTRQAFEGVWGTRTEYSKFSKKIKTDQELDGTFETQKKITFED